MDLKSYNKFLPLILQLIIHFFPPGFLCQTDDQNYRSCPPFQCGNLTDITYPFWDPDAARSIGILNSRGKLCGPPGFNLNCRSGDPILIISGVRYKVLSIDYPNRTLTVIRQDLWNNPCLPIPANTTLVASGPFKTLPPYKQPILTLNYNCTRPSPGPSSYMSYNNFTCGGSGTTNIILRAGDVSTDHFTFTCSRQITVPVNDTAASALETSTASPLDALHAALAAGFPILWSADDVQCADCNRRRGACGYDQIKRNFSCDDILTTTGGRPIGRNLTLPEWEAPPLPHQVAPSHNDGSPTPANNTPEIPTIHKASNRTLKLDKTATAKGCRPLDPAPRGMPPPNPRI